MAIRYEDIVAARELLELPERASMEKIKANYRKLLNQWHPDKCTDDPEKCQEKTRKIIEAYKVIMTYCDQYRYSFTKEDIKKYLMDEDWWFERFGNDPVWGNVKHKR